MPSAASSTAPSKVGPATHPDPHPHPAPAAACHTAPMPYGAHPWLTRTPHHAILRLSRNTRTLPGVVLSGSWDKTVKMWDPRAPTGTSQVRSLGDPHNTGPVSPLRNPHSSDSSRVRSRDQGTYTQPERVYTMDVADRKLVVGTAGRHVYIYDVRNMSETLQKRESSLKYQTRAISCFPTGEGPKPFPALMLARLCDAG